MARLLSRMSTHFQWHSAQESAQPARNQLRGHSSRYLVSPPFTSASAAADLKSFFEGFIKGFEAKFDKVRWARILATEIASNSLEKP